MPDQELYKLDTIHSMVSSLLGEDSDPHSSCCKVSRTARLIESVLCMADCDLKLEVVQDEDGNLCLTSEPSRELKKWLVLSAVRFRFFGTISAHSYSSPMISRSRVTSSLAIAAMLRWVNDELLKCDPCSAPGSSALCVGEGEYSAFINDCTRHSNAISEACQKPC